MTIEIDHVSMTLDGTPMIRDLCYDISSDSSYVIAGATADARTTLIRIILGLTQPDAGRIRLLGDYKYSHVNAGVVFREDRLCEDYPADINVAMVNKRLSPNVAREELARLLPTDALDRPVRDLTPAQRRLVCIVRACIIPSDVILMDEPFAGLSADDRTAAIRYINAIKATTPFVVASSDRTGLEFCKEIAIG